MRRFLRYLLISIAFPVSAQAVPAMGNQGMVAAAHPMAAEAGITMLRTGGNAVDAAVATAFTLAVVEPFSSGLGGGGMALLRIGDDVTLLDFREVAPQAATADLFMQGGQPQPKASRDGMLAVAVPGAVAGYLTLHERYGKLSRAAVLAPAIAAAEKGFAVDIRYRHAAKERLTVLRADADANRIFLAKNPRSDLGLTPPLGYRIVQPELAATLRALAEDGAAAFYTGEIATRLVADMEARHGLIRIEDLAAYQVRTRAPLLGSYLGYTVATAPPPSAGGTNLLTILNVMEAGHALPWHSPNALHLYIEACKRAFADRALIGDPAFTPDLSARLTAKDRGELLARLIAYDHTATKAADVPPGQGAHLPLASVGRGGSIAVESPDTTHLSVVDQDGNAVALTTTLNYSFGAGVVARGTGVLLNDHMDDFAMAPGVPNTYGVVGTHANAIAPGKVPVSSMTPTLVFAGLSTRAPIRLVVGSPGGPRIPTTVAQIILNHLGHGADIDTAIAAGRVHHQHLPDVVRVERFALEHATLQALRKLGHTLEELPPWSNANAIAIDPDTGLRTGAADPRGIGVALAQ